MEEKLRKLYNDVLFLLSQAPDSEECSYSQMELYEEMANLIESLELAGIGR